MPSWSCVSTAWEVIGRVRSGEAIGVPTHRVRCGAMGKGSSLRRQQPYGCGFPAAKLAIRSV